MPTLDPRTQSILDEIVQRRYRFRKQADATPAADETELTSDWSLHLCAPETALTRQLITSFRAFAQRCYGLTFADAPTNSVGSIGPVIEWQLAEPAATFNPQDPECEAFELEVAPRQITIRARHERGLLHGTHRLEWLMANRGGPYLAHQQTPFRPAFIPRLSNGVFIPGIQSPTAIGHYPDEYLELMSFYGINGVHLYVDLWHLFRSDTLPELQSPGYDEEIAALRAFNQRTLAYGIDLYLHLNTPPLDAGHPVFAAHPDVRGAKVEIFMEELSGRDWYNFCSGSPKVHAGYSEAVEALFSAAPELAGAYMIIGGECFYHCFTRPAASARGETNCPTCRGRSPSTEIAALTNTVAAAIKRTGAHKSLYAWPYSAFIWSANDPEQLEWVDHLSPDVSVQTNFDGGDALANGSGVRVYDYNILEIGPSAVFAAQAERLHDKGRRIYSKIETDTTPDAFFLPHLPLHDRWHRRYEAMRELGVAGFMGQWRFYGMSASIPEELQLRSTWADPKGAGADWLEEIARRDYLLSPDAARRVCEGWKLLSDAWDAYPYSAMTAGERAAYMRGPFYLGPAHPLIFDVQGHYNLPRSFWLLRGDLTELASTPEELEELQRNAKPRYVSDLLVTLPYGADRYLSLVDECRQRWASGLAILEAELANGTEEATKELNICRAIGTHLTTLANVVRFYRERDRIQSTPCTAAEFSEGIATLQQILSDEIANAEAILPVLDTDPRIGYGHCYGTVYDAGMVRAKIAQCRFVRDTELPRFSDVVRFHVWLEN